MYADVGVGLRTVRVLVEYDVDEVVVSEPRFHMHAAGVTMDQAIQGFRRVLAGYLDILEKSEDRLGPHLKNQLAYLRELTGA